MAQTWLLPSLLALFFYGIGQGLVKSRVGEIDPGRFCLHFILAKSVVNLGFFFSQPHPDPLDPAGHAFLLTGFLAYLLDGAGWILYFQSIVGGPITLVGTLSASYPAFTALLAAIFLKEAVTSVQALGILLTLLGCMSLAVPQDTASMGIPEKTPRKPWIGSAILAVACWSIAQTLVKFAYSLPEAHEVTLSLPNTLGGLLTLGVYGFWKTRGQPWPRSELSRAFLPMGLLAGGDLWVLIANRLGPVSLVTPITGAYPAVTALYASIFLKERIRPLHGFGLLSILAGMILSTFTSGAPS
jgi:drug/metabolite transporter (DMT)-like permease